MSESSVRTRLMTGTEGLTSPLWPAQLRGYGSEGISAVSSELGDWTTSDNQHIPVWSTICGWLSATVHALEFKCESMLSQLASAVTNNL